MNTWTLVRDTPGFGVAAQTGTVAEVAEFNGGTCVLRWLTEPHGIEIYPSRSALSEVRESSGRSRLEPCGGLR